MISFINSETSALRLSETSKLGLIVIFVVGSFPGTEMSIETFLFELYEFLDSIVMYSTVDFFALSFKNNSLLSLFDKSFILAYESKLFLVTLELYLETYLKV